MPGSAPIDDELRKLFTDRDMPFREFMEIALYRPGSGYYSRPESPVGRGGDYVTAPTLSPVFAFAIARLVSEVVSRC